MKWPSKFWWNIKVPHSDSRQMQKKVEKIWTNIFKIDFKEGWFFSKISNFSKFLLDFEIFFFGFQRVLLEGILGNRRIGRGNSRQADISHSNSPSYRMAKFWIWISRQNRRRRNFFSTAKVPLVWVTDDPTFVRFGHFACATLDKFSRKVPVKIYRWQLWIPFNC